MIPGSRAIAVAWADLSAAATQRGRPRPVNDTWITACCLAYDLPLATLNLKDFKDSAEHHGLRLREPQNRPYVLGQARPLLLRSGAPDRGVAAGEVLIP